jgi:hypothetical protein
LWDAQGQYDGTVGVVGDITDGYRAQEALRSSEERARIRLICRRIPEGLVAQCR